MAANSANAPPDATTALPPGDEDPIRVVARLKPTAPSSARALSVTAAGPAALACGGGVYGFDAVADARASQEAVWELAARAISDNALAGYNGTIFAYGQTGSGKTHTIYGPAADGAAAEQRGILPRTLDYVFSRMRAAEAAAAARAAGTGGAPPVSYSCRASFLEIYNERIYDLLEGADGGLSSSAATSSSSSSSLNASFVGGGGASSSSSSSSASS